MAPKYLWVNGSARRLDHLIPKLTNSIQNLVEVSVHCLNGPPKRLVDNSKSLVVTNHMEEHCNLFLYCDPSLSETRLLALNRLHKAKKGALVILSMDRHSPSLEL